MAPERYGPEKQVSVLADDDGVRIRNTLLSPPEWILVEDVSSIGAAVVALLARTEPLWPTVAAANVAQPDDRWLIHPLGDGHTYEGPVATLSEDTTAAAVGEAILDALRRSVDSAERERPDPTLFDAELEELGLTVDRLFAVPFVHVLQTSDGTIRATTGFDSEDEVVTVDVADARTVGTMITGLLGGAAPARSQDPARIPPSFGPKTGWLAIGDAPRAEVVQAMQLDQLEDLPLAAGVDRALESGVFVLPTIDGWTLAMGADLADGPLDVSALSSSLGTTVQLFRTHRVVELHEWAWVDHGEVRRHLRYLGESGEHESSGAPTKAERSLGYDDPAFLPGEDDVFTLAGAWSLDPTDLARHEAGDSSGTWGRLPGT